MGDFLPLETLKKVKDLTLMLRYYEHEPHWPDSWNQLTSITRLEWKCQVELASDPDAFVLFPFRMKGLIDIKLTTSYDLFYVSGEGDILSLIGCHPMLSRLQLLIVGQTIIEWARFLRMRHFEFVKEICMAVEKKTPGLKFHLSEINERDEHALPEWDPYRKRSTLFKFQVTFTLPS